MYIEIKFIEKSNMKKEILELKLKYDNAFISFVRHCKIAKRIDKRYLEEYIRQSNIYNGNYNV